ncbi:MAG: SET domain-containing protein-lysine N-methyltransferase [Labilithrix sp.]|nr:SET domain-containing protein-lysine N-methyltransferase [Labilithrix sp.]
MGRPFRLRRSKIHGTGVVATRTIRAGRRIIEYIGERITHKEAERRYSVKAKDDSHTFLFTISSRHVIDAGVGGNVARFINHSCDPNCEAVIERGRVFIETVRAIAPDEELAYDYNIGREDNDPPNVEKIFGCHCGSKKCRGTMITPLDDD